MNGNSRDPAAASAAAPQRAARACVACQRYKRRCDKALPSCSLCSKQKRACDYSHNTESNLRARVQELQGIIAARDASLSPSAGGSSSMDDTQGLGLSCIRFQKKFLDSDLHDYNPLGQTAPKDDGGVTIPSEVLHQLGSLAQQAEIAVHFFESVHAWMPIVSRARWRRLCESPQSDSILKPDHAILLLAMKLVQYEPETTLDAIRCPIYTSSKRWNSCLEMVGAYSLERLQASALIAVYEMGHGILPAAYMTLGSCATLAVALGIHNEAAPQMLHAPRNWVDWEERLRTWWMVLILDRIITAGGDHRPPSTPEPGQNSLLPADDDAWDRGGMSTPERMFISAPHRLLDSPFARVAQASHLLGKVIAHCNDQASDMPAVQANIRLLSQAIDSLLELLTKDDKSVVRFSNSIAVCFSALMKLYDNHTCDTMSPQHKAQYSMEDLTLIHRITEHCRQSIITTADRIVHFVSIIQPAVKAANTAQCPLAPWTSHCFYRASTTLTWVGSVIPEKDDGKYARGKAACVEMLALLRQRWKTGGAYLEALQQVEKEMSVGTY